MASDAARERFLREVRKTFGTPEGKRVAHWILSLGRIFSVTFRKNVEGPFLEGRRSVSLEVLEAIKDADKELLLQIMALGFEPPEETETELTASAKADKPDKKERQHA